MLVLFKNFPPQLPIDTDASAVWRSVWRFVSEGVDVFAIAIVRFHYLFNCTRAALSFYRLGRPIALH